jgi:hypothetical protein
MSAIYDRVLVKGNEEELDEYINSKACIIVDWREEDDAIIEMVCKRIPEAGMSFKFNDDYSDLLITYKGSQTNVGLTLSMQDRYITIRALSRVLAGDFEIRAFKQTLDSDTHSLYVKPCAWWAEMDARFPNRMKRLFVKITDALDFR